MINDLEQLSEDELENALWNLGLDSHNSSHDDIKSYLHFLEKNQIKLPPKIILDAVSYIMHTFFSKMTNEEKDYCLNILLGIDINRLTNFGDIFDILGILFKMASESMKPKILSYILTNVNLTLKNPSALISICNSFSYIYDELNSIEQFKIRDKMRFLIENNSYPHLSDTLLFTLNLFEEDVNNENNFSRT